MKIGRFLGIPEKVENNTGKNRTASSKNLLSLETGDRFKATVLDIKRNQVTIRLSDGTSLTAKSLVIPDAHIGEEMEFIVQSNKDGQILINISEQGSEQQQQNLLLNILSSANIMVTEDTLNILKALMDAELPIDKNTIQTLLQQLKTNSEADLKSLIFMLKEDISITSENIKFVQQTAKHENNIKNQIETLSWKIAALDEPEIKQSILEIFLPTSEKEIFDIEDNIISEKIQDFQMPQELTEEQKNILQNTIELFKTDESILKHLLEALKDTGDTKQIFSSLAEIFPDNNKLFFEVLGNDTLIETFTELFDEKNSALEKETDNEKATKLSNAIKKELFIDLDKQTTTEEFNSYYQKLNEKLSQALKTIEKSNTPASQELKETLNSLKDNIDFMSQINNFQEFVQIPFAVNGNENQCDLYIFNETKHKKISKNRASVLLALDLKMLGHFEAFIQKDFNNISCQFRTVKQGTQELLKTNMPLLQAALKNEGYNLYHVAYKQITEPFNILNTSKDLGIKTATDNTSPAYAKRYSFDMRT